MLGAAAAFLVVVVAVIAVEMLLRDDLAMTMTTCLVFEPSKYYINLDMRHCLFLISSSRRRPS
jgi:hypothetical protein